MSVSVFLSVCLCLSVYDYIAGTTRPIFTKFFAYVTYDGGSILLGRRSDMLSISGLWMTSYLHIIIRRRCRAEAVRRQ